MLLSPNLIAKETDPTKPLIGISSVKSSDGKKNGALVLQSIIRSNNIRKAVIDGEILYVGDMYKGFELLKISSTGVVMRSSQGERELSLFSGVIVNSK